MPLRARYAMPSTGIGRTATASATHERFAMRCPVWPYSLAVPCPACRASAGGARRAGKSVSRQAPPMLLRARYAMSGTGIAYAATVLRMHYAVSGTDVRKGMK
eukprot:2083377-Rhodomonas_salina.2